MAIRTPLQVRRLLWNKVKNAVWIEDGYCKRETREAINVEPSTTKTAKACYQTAKFKFTGYWIPGALAFWSNDGDWHVAWCAFRKGYVYTVDCPNKNFWNRIPLADVHKHWPTCTFVGFTRDMDGKTVVKVPKIKRKYIP